VDGRACAQVSPSGDFEDEEFTDSLSIGGRHDRRVGRGEAATEIAPSPERKKTMKIMVIVKANEDTEASKMPTEQQLTEMGAYNEELVKAGLLLAGEGLHPSAKGKRMRFSGSQKTVIDGPFAETKELIAGFWIWQVKSMDEALEWARRMPSPHEGEAEIELRPIFEAEDFGEALTPELRAQEERLRAEAARRQA
jgi:hypothetical protein